MANKRDFKKYVTAIGAGVSEDMMIIYYCHEGMDKAVVDSCVGKVLIAVTKAVSEANVSFDKGVRAFEDKKAYSKARSAFFKALFMKIATDFTAEIEAALKEFNAAIPQKVKEENKAHA